MSTDPWTDPDPQPGDFDAELAKLDPRYVERHEGDPEARLIVLVGVGARTRSGSSASRRPAARTQPLSSPSCYARPSAPPYSGNRFRSSITAALRETGSPTHQTPAVHPKR